jgi:uroporphyrinogen-III decarboxylase
VTPSERLRAAILKKPLDRVPVVPKIWVDLGAVLTGVPIQRVVEEPLTAMQAIAFAARDVGADAARQFHFPARRTAWSGAGEELIEVDGNGRRVGRIDLAGGLQTHLDDPDLFDLKEPYWTYYYHYYRADEPFIRDEEDVRRMVMPDAGFLDAQGWAERQLEVARAVGDDLCLIGDCSSATLAYVVSLRGLERTMFDLIESPRLVHRIMERGVELAVLKGRYAMDLGLDILRLNDSVANMSVISPYHWREFVLPHVRDVVSELHAYSADALVYCHICGNVLPVLEDILETGIDCVGPLDPLGGFTPAQARAVVGDRRSLMGGVDTQTFVTGTPDAVIAEAQAAIAGAGLRHRAGAALGTVGSGEAGAPTGFVLGSGCVIPRTAKRENLLALRTAADTFHD